MHQDYLNKGAIFDPTHRYRYILWRTWDFEQQAALFVMLNPSTADGEEDDPTIRRCVRFAQDWGYGGLKVVNLFALISPDPRKLLTDENAVGDWNDTALLGFAANSGIVVAAWGAFKEARRRASDVLELLSEFPLFCLGKSKDGSPTTKQFV